MAGVANTSLFAPGEIVGISGFYTALHRKKKPTHKLLFIEGQVFPSCNCCGKTVRFSLACSAPLIGEDPDFRQGRIQASKIILCVCNDADKLLCRSLLMLRRGFKVFQAESSRVAVRIIGHCWPDCVLLEYSPEERDAAKNVSLMKQQCAEVKLFLANGGYAIPKPLQEAMDAMIDSSDQSQLLEKLEKLFTAEPLAA
jgi:hypothetical protein